ncbi:VWA domain-containing protein [Paenibacillus sp. ACRRX]|uniref:fibronectin type III domain-containing protein n=1 Tax=Paenibacillus sp. ACRRX TaxID=2918206 RepID=UPI001EF5D28E|nr:VWA domain-containing protein [Paenibacillus sp. ACRRX]
MSSLTITPPVQAASKVDIVFVIDRSGSMGSSIDSVKNKVGRFTDLLKTKGISYQLGLVTYEEYVTKYDLTSNVDTFKQYLNNVSVDGGTENGLDAIMEAAQSYPFEINASKYFILIGDEVVTSYRNYSVDSVKQYLKNNNIILTAISSSDIEYQFKQLSDATGGLSLNLYSDFDANLTSIFDQIQRIPTLQIITPTPDQLLSDANTSFIPMVKAMDPDSDTLRFAYYVDSETTPRDTKVITNTATSQNVSFNAINLASLSEGTHSFRFTVNDGTAMVQDVVQFRVDKSNPVIGNMHVAATDTIIQVNGTAADSLYGLHPQPYRYSIGSNTSAWTAAPQFESANLVPNTEYNVRFEARDYAGHIASTNQSVVTKAQTPTINVNQVSESSFIFQLQDSNPAHTQYLIKAGQKYVSENGTLSSTPSWVTPTNKQIRVTGLSPNSLYSLQARAKNKSGMETVDSPLLNAATLATPPSNITIEPAQQWIKVNWPQTSGVTSYDIEADGVVYTNGTSGSFMHSGLAPNTKHTYRVRANNAGGIGNWSEPATYFTLPDPPGVPNFVLAAPLQTQITLKWDIVAKAESYDIEADGTVLDTGGKTSFEHKGLQPTTDHTYRLRAKNKGGTGEWSKPKVVKTLPYPPEAPQQVTADVMIRSVNLSWAKTVGATGYEVEADGFIVDNGDKQVFQHDSLEPLSGHMYRVRAVNEGGKGSWSHPVHVTTLPEKPAIPSNVMTTAEKDSISITWYKVPHAERYEIELDGGSIVKLDSNQYEHLGLKPDSQHTYRVRAHNVSGYSEWSTPITLSTFPADSSANYSLTNIAAVVTNRFITISWDAVAPAAQYEIEVDGVLYNNGTKTIYQHSGLKASELHSYKIRVKNEDYPGQWVAMLSMFTLPNPPDAPANIDAFANDNSIEIRWHKGDGVTGYDIEVDGKVINAGDGSVYTHAGLDSGTSHTYRVRAKNETGVTAWSSAIVKSTTNPTYMIRGTKDQTFDLALFATNVQDFSELTYVVTYDPQQLEVIDLYGFTPRLDRIQAGKITDSNLEVTNEIGKITFKMHQNIVPGTSWTGEITSIVFKSKQDGESSIKATVE